MNKPQAPNRNPWTVDRKQPYTEAGIRRLRCIRCRIRPAAFQWQICSDGNRYRPLCAHCDVELNRMVLEWVQHPEAAVLGLQYAAQKGVTL